MLDGTTMVVLGAIGGFILTTWRYLKDVALRLTSYLVVTVSVEDKLMQALARYCLDNLRLSPYGPKTFTGDYIYVRNIKRKLVVAMEHLGKHLSVYWRGWRPLAIRHDSSRDNGNRLTVTFLRGTWDIDQLLIDATDYFNEMESGNDRRHYVRHVVGRDHDGDDGDPRKPASLYENSPGEASSNTYRECRILKYSRDDLSPSCGGDTNTLAGLALSEDARTIVEEARRWKASETWYRDRGIPWRRGVLIHGDPGNGKTALVRGVAEELDLPVYAFDLASMTNAEFQRAWSNMLRAVPCIGLIEDIDSVFQGRQNVTGRKYCLTFDCLLNCFDGIERSDGLLLFITTNKLDSIDPAIGVPVGDGQLRSSRPGRIDRVLKMEPPSKEGRVKICRRILPEYAHYWDDMAEIGAGDSGAQFQDRCAQLAEALYWSHANGDQTPLRSGSMQWLLDALRQISPREPGSRPGSQGLTGQVGEPDQDLRGPGGPCAGGNGVPAH